MEAFIGVVLITLSPYIDISHFPLHANMTLNHVEASSKQLMSVPFFAYEEDSKICKMWSCNFFICKLPAGINYM